MLVLPGLCRKAAAQDAPHHLPFAWAVDGTRDQILAALPRFFGDTPAGYLPRWREGEPLADPFARIFNGVPLPQRDLDNGYRILGAAKVHEFGTKAFVVTVHNGLGIVLAALLHRNCGVSPAGSASPSCADVPILALFHPARVTLPYGIASEIVEGIGQLISDASSAASGGSTVVGARFAVHVHRLQAD